MNAVPPEEIFLAVEKAPKPGRRISAKRAATVAVALVALAGVVAYGRYWWTAGRFLVSTDDAYVGGDVTVIAPKVAGFIKEVAAGDNQAVRAGDLLDPPRRSGFPRRARARRCGGDSAKGGARQS